MLALRQILPIVIAALYVISPLDAIPDFLPGLGWVDDLFVVGVLLWFLNARRRGQSPWDAFHGRRRGHWARGPAGPPPEDLGTDFSRQDPFTLLEITRQASPEEIKAAYRRAVARYHPDKVAHL